MDYYHVTHLSALLPSSCEGCERAPGAREVRGQQSVQRRRLHAAEPRNPQQHPGRQHQVRLRPPRGQCCSKHARASLKKSLTLVLSDTRRGANPVAFASAMGRAASTTSWFTASPAPCRRRGRSLRGTSGPRVYRWRRRWTCCPLVSWGFEQITSVPTT